MTFARFTTILIVLALVAVLMFISGLRSRSHHVTADSGQGVAARRAA